MKLKSILLMLGLFLTLTLCIGVISAEDNVDIDVDANGLNPINSSSDSVDQDISGSKVDSSANQSSIAAVPKSSSTTVTKISTKVSADQVANEYKKSKYFKVKVKDKKGHAVQNVKIKLKIYTGSKTKIYIVKTNSKGVAKFNTKSLKLGNHKVVISSANSKYKISKNSKIFIGKKRYAIVKPGVKKILKNKDVLGVNVYNDDGEKEAKIVYKKTPKYTKVTKAIFYLKNKKTGKIITKTDSAEFDNGRWELPDEDFSRRYTLVKVKVWYLSSK